MRWTSVPSFIKIPSSIATLCSRHKLWPHWPLTGDLDHETDMAESWVLNFHTSGAMRWTSAGQVSSKSHQALESYGADTICDRWTDRQTSLPKAIRLPTEWGRHKKPYVSPQSGGDAKSIILEGPRKKRNILSNEAQSSILLYLCIITIQPPHCHQGTWTCYVWSQDNGSPN